MLYTAPNIAPRCVQFPSDHLSQWRPLLSSVNLSSFVSALPCFQHYTPAPPGTTDCCASRYHASAFFSRYLCRVLLGRSAGARRAPAVTGTVATSPAVTCTGDSSSEVTNTSSSSLAGTGSGSPRLPPHCAARPGPPPRNTVAGPGRGPSTLASPSGNSAIWRRRSFQETAAQQ